CQQGYNYPWTF
nr:immunoglobulin light chain junction region [Macaca mulatta]MOV78563.1 immunoglobulin light chain junction region [Macaca mulatta]MOV78974.1 immunoglobulin light chain junction region [Macaca mulatta]MOV80060.1 immunoglobulin light chain junction region [Macaca mulatta]MOV80326.1 immunoglobulin light chain junction region [Macaca mulatta]